MGDGNRSWGIDPYGIRSETGGGSEQLALRIPESYVAWWMGLQTGHTDLDAYLPLSPDFLKPDPKASPSVVDAGADLSALFSTDFAGVARPAGGAWDIGAFEYRSQESEY